MSPSRLCTAAPSPPRCPSRHNAGPGALFNSAAFGGRRPAPTGVTIHGRTRAAFAGGGGTFTKRQQTPALVSRVAFCCILCGAVKKKKKRKENLLRLPRGSFARTVRRAAESETFVRCFVPEMNGCFLPLCSCGCHEVETSTAHERQLPR